MSAKPRLLLPDTVVIIATMACGRWPALCGAYAVMVPSIIAGEMQFYFDKDGVKQHVELVTAVTTGRHRFTHKPTVSGPGVSAAVNLDPIAAGEFALWSAPLGDLQHTKMLLHPELRPRVDDGELEAVTYLRLLQDGEGVAFVTADVGAIHATVAFDRPECGMSLEHVLAKCGHSMSLAYEFGDAHLKESVRDGEVRKLQGRALSGPATSSKAAGRRKNG